MPRALTDRTSLRRWVRWRHVVVPALVLLAVTLPDLGAGDWRTDTGRYTAVGLQAWRSLFAGVSGETPGGLFWTPHLQPDRLYFAKPPLGLWLHGFAAWVLGPSVFAARLPSVLAALIGVLATAGAVRVFHGRRAAFAAGVVLALTLEYFRRTREASLDLWLAALLAVAVWAVCRGVRRGQRPGVWLGVGGAMVGAALMVKPLVALVGLVVLGGWALWAGGTRFVRPVAVMLTSAVVVALPWHVSMGVMHGEAFWGTYFGAEVADRAAGQIETKPWWFYLVLIARTYWPWLVLVVLCVAAWARGRLLARDARGLWLAAAWAGVWVVALSVFPDKRPRYLVVAYPALAWLAGVRLVLGPAATGRMASVVRTVRRGWPWALQVLLLAALGSAVLPVDLGKLRNPMWDELEGQLDGPMARRVLVAGALGTNDQGRLYLERGAWPGWVGGEAFPTRGDVPIGAVIIDRASGWRERPGERVIARLEPGYGHGSDGLVLSERVAE